MSKFLLIVIITLSSTVVGSSLSYAQFVYSEVFGQGVTYCPGSSQYDNWLTFRASLPPSGVQSITMSGSQDPLGITCSNPVMAQQIADAMRSNSPVFNILCDGNTWAVSNNCQTGCGLPNNDLVLSAQGNGTCSCGNQYVLRPGIGNSNWGGVGGGGSCFEPTQTMTVTVDLLVCANANGLIWCYNDQACGQACNDVCAAGGLQPIADNTVWFEAQNSQAKCEAITQAFGLGNAAFFGNFQFGCVEDSLGTHSVGGGLVTNVICSSDPNCPNAHRTQMDTQGVACGPSSRRSVCPCEVVPQSTVKIKNVNNGGNQLIKNRTNKIAISGVTPNKKAWLFWGFKMGTFTFNGGKCDGTELNINPNQLIAKLRANSSGNVNRTFFVPSTSANKAKFQALDYASCGVSPVFDAILLND